MKDAEIYPGKNITDLLEQIVNNCESEKKRALDMFERIQEKCESEEQMMLIGPVAAEYLEIASKQTDNLIKCAETIRKYHALDLENDDSASLSEMERNELLVGCYMIRVALKIMVNIWYFGILRGKIQVI